MYLLSLPNCDIHRVPNQLILIYHKTLTTVKPFPLRPHKPSSFGMLYGPSSVRSVH
jgi:hypothetical protein